MVSSESEQTNPFDKQDIARILGNPKITFVLGKFNQVSNNIYRWTRRWKKHSMRETR
jgi:hypothetical protein